MLLFSTVCSYQNLPENAMMTVKAKMSGYRAKCGLSIGITDSRCVDIALFNNASKYSLKAFTTEAAP